MIKITQYLHIQEKCINTVKETCGGTIAKTIFNSGNLKIFLQGQG